MERVLNDEQTLLRESVTAFARRCREKNLSVKDKLREAAKAGYVSALVPPDQGGSGLSTLELCLIAEALGRDQNRLPVAHIVAGVFAMSSSVDSDIRAVQADGCKGRAVIVPAFQGYSHLGAGSNAPLMVAGTRGGEIAISGERFVVPMLDEVAGFVVDACHGSDDLLVFIAVDSDGLSIDQKKALDGSSLASLSFNGVRVSHSHILARGKPASDLKDRLEFTLKMGVSAELLGLASAALETTIEYVKARVQFGRPIGSFQAVQHRIVNDAAQLEAASHLLYEAASAMGGKAASRRVRGSAVKAKADAVSMATLNSAVQLHGAIGFSDEYKLSAMMRRVLLLRSLVGPPGRHSRDYFDRQEVHGSELPRFRGESADDMAFREEARQWLEEGLPQRLRFLPARPTFEDAKWWHRELYHKGWIAPGWPRAYGGMEASLARQIILAEELGRVGAPEISNQAIEHLGPILISFGSQGQKEQHLSSMLSGDTIWGQGYSEPGAGSDLANLRTRAVRDGDEMVVNGQKIWTTWGHYADWMFALVRTDPNASKPQAGLTFILIDLSSPGITRRGIRTLTGEDELAEVFFENVRVPISNIVSKENDGWRVANALLTRERMRAASPVRCVNALQQLKQVAKHGALHDQGFRDRVAVAEINVLALTAAYESAVSRRSAGQEPGAEISYIKLLTAELAQHLSELLLEAAGSDSALAEPLYGVYPALGFLQSRRLTIFGGTSEVQRNILAKRVLSLPS